MSKQHQSGKTCIIDTAEKVDEIDDEDIHLEPPGCIESLVSSSQQLQNLAEECHQYFIKNLLCYGYASKSARPLCSDFQSSSPTQNLGKSKLTFSQLLKDQSSLDLMNSVMIILPFLEELTQFLAKCFATIEITFKRCLYHLNKETNQSTEQFQLPPETKIYSIFFAIMDISYALVSLDKTILLHTNINQGLATFRTACELTLEQSGEKSASVNLIAIDTKRLRGLIDILIKIQSSLCNPTRGIFGLCLEHLEKLEVTLLLRHKNKRCMNLYAQFEHFLELFGSNLLERFDSQVTYLSHDLSAISSSLLNFLTPNLYIKDWSQKLFGYSSIYVIYCCIFQKPMTKITKTFLQVIQKLKSFTILQALGSNSFLSTREFLDKHLKNQFKIDPKVLKQLSESNETLLKVNIGSKLDDLTLKLYRWSFIFQTEVLRSSEAKLENDQAFRLQASVRKKLDILKKGLVLVQEINCTVKSILSAHNQYNQNIAEYKITQLMKMVVLVKSVQAEFINHHNVISNYLLVSHRSSMRSWSVIFSLIRERISNHSDSSLHRVASICSETSNFQTSAGRALISICLTIIIPHLKMKEITDINSILSMVDINFNEEIKMSSDCGYLFWNMTAFSLYYFHCIEEDPCVVEEIAYFHRALNDIPGLLTPSQGFLKADGSSSTDRLNLERDEFIKCLGIELMGQFKTDLLDKICQELEIELRFQAHREINPTVHNPFKRHIYNFKRIFHCKVMNFHIFDQAVSLRCYVEQYLNRVCYNLTSIAPHDWLTYDSIANIARHNYGLQLANLQLPKRDSDYGLDLLDITRNLSLFVCKYSYDLTNELFIEKCTNKLPSSTSSSLSGSASALLPANSSTLLNQMLNVFQVKHIARSIQTHGYSVLNTSVNCSYQLMKRLVSFFLKQMSDERLRAMLTKENLAINSGGQSSIDFERAHRMANKFRLGSSANLLGEFSAQTGSFDLDSMRQSITQLGNILAFIRLLRSGALGCVSKTVAYLPDFDDLALLRFGQYIKMEFRGHPGEPLCRASANLDLCLQDFDDNLSVKTNYLGTIINLFSQVMLSAVDSLEASKIRDDSNGRALETERSGEEETKANEEDRDLNSGHDHETRRNLRPSRCDHLHQFYLLIPALTIHYIKCLNNCKERAISRSSASRFGALITDDGFPMGVAFLLIILKQTDSFAKLEWFQQVSAKLDTDKREVERRIEDSKYEESLKQTAIMTLRRLNRLKLEYDALGYSLSSALLLLKSSTISGQLE